MKTKIIAKDRKHLMNLIEQEIQQSGNKCSLNHIDVTQVNDMHHLFCESPFNGDISQWDVSQVIDMSSMFLMTIYNGDISKWDVSKVENMLDMFYVSEFSGDLSKWKPYSLEKMGGAFLDCPIQEPYWAKFEDQKERVRAIDSYILHNELGSSLSDKNSSPKKAKI